MRKKGSSAQKPSSIKNIISIHGKKQPKQHQTNICLACAFTGLLTIFYFISALCYERKANTSGLFSKKKEE